MSKAKVGSGRLEPFKKGDTGSESIGGSTSKGHVREGFTPYATITKASREETELTPFKVGNESPGVNRGNPTVPPFRKKESNGIDMMGYKPFKT